MTSRPAFTWAAQILGGALLLGGAVSFYFGQASAGWPLVDATILYSTARAGGRGPDTVDIRYVYRVDGREYQGDRWRYSFFMNRSRSIEVSAAQASYPVGTRATVAVDPADPARSVLEPGIQWVDLVWVCGGVLIAGVGLLNGRRAADTAPVPVPIGASLTAKSLRTASASRAGRRRGLPGALLVLAAIALGFAVERIHEGVASSDWPVVDGRVLYSAAGGAGSGGSHPIEIRYEYFIDGVRRVGAYSRVAGHDEAFGMARAHHRGDMVRVHYDPAHPGRSAIVTGITWRNFVLLMVAVLLVGFAALVRATRLAA